MTGRPYDQDADPDHEGNFVDGLAVALALLLILLSVAIAVWAVFGA